MRKVNGGGQRPPGAPSYEPVDPITICFDPTMATLEFGFQDDVEAGTTVDVRIDAYLGSSQSNDLIQGGAPVTETVTYPTLQPPPYDIDLDAGLGDFYMRFKITTSVGGQNAEELFTGNFLVPAGLG